jgi:hypothetical protein
MPCILSEKAHGHFHLALVAAFFSSCPEELFIDKQNASRSLQLVEKFDANKQKAGVSCRRWVAERSVRDSK